jgi:hypothetical protein
VELGKNDFWRFFLNLKMKFVFLGLIIILILGYFGVSVRTVATNPTSQDNIEYVSDTSRSFWDKYLKDPATYLWNDIWVDLFWHPFIDNMKRLKDTNTTEAEDHAPTVSY